MRVFRTGNEAYWCPVGFRVFIDTSWDRRGSHVMCRAQDLTVLSSGGPSSLMRVQVSGPCLTDMVQILGFFPGGNPGNSFLGYNSDPKMGSEEAEALFERLTSSS